jgi:hypothetical protein
MSKGIESPRQKPNQPTEREKMDQQNAGNEFRPVNCGEIIQQLGRNNLLAISGGRVQQRETWHNLANLERLLSND